MMRRVGAALALGCALTLAACDEPQAPEGRQPLLLTIESGDAQQGSIGLPLPDSPTVVLLDVHGQPQPNLVVAWRVLEGGGAVSESLTTTDAQGRTRVAWTLGEGAGRQLLGATSPLGPGVTFRADALVYFGEVSAGRSHTCGLDALGNAYCWGSDGWGQLGNGSGGSAAQPERVAGGYRFRAIAAGYQHSCGLATSGEVYCWGDNDNAQLGDGTHLRRGAPILVSGTQRFSALSAGGVHTCGLTADGQVWCWGGNVHGQLGAESGACTIGTYHFTCARTPIRVELPGTAAEVSAGEFHTCARLTDGRAFCWGSNDWGELGLGTSGGTVTRPAPVAGGVGFRALAAGSLNTCGVSTTGQAYCWGMSRGGVTGIGGTWNAVQPTPLASTERFRAVQLGALHGCALSEGGGVYCWGNVTGDPALSFSLIPVLVQTEGAFSRLSVGGGHVCGTSAASLWCWGSNADGQLGVAPAGGRKERPVRVGPALPPSS